MNDTNDRLIPTLLPNFTNIIDIAVGNNHSLILTNDEKVYTFGGNDVNIF